MKHLIQILTSLVLVCLLSVTSKAQSWQWATKAGGIESDYANGIDVDDNGNSYITGTFFNTISFGSTTLTNPGLWSVYIARYDVDGNLVWAKIVASDLSISVGGICVDQSGRISIVGQFLGTGSFGNTNPVTLVSSGDYDVFVAAYDNTGEIKWVKSAGGPGVDYGGGISTDNHGNIFITGDFHASGFPLSSSKIFIAKYDSIGNCPWVKLSQAYGNFHYGMGIKSDAGGNCYITGQFFGSLIFDSSELGAGNPEANIFIAKFDAGGNTVWTQKAGAASGYAGGSAIAIDNTGSAYITGFFKGTIAFGTLSLTGSPGLYYECFIAKCDANGDFQWVNKAVGPGPGMAISTDDAGDCYVTGYFTDAITFGSISLTNSGSKDIFVAKANSSGNFVWATQCGGLSDDNITGIKVSSQGVYLTGNFMGDINFGSSISLNADSNSQYDIFTARINNITGIDEGGNSSSGIFLFPNPATDEIQLKGISGEEEYTIYDVTGRVVSQGITGETNRISVTDLECGIYIIHVIANRGSGKSTLIKFIKS